MIRIIVEKNLTKFVELTFLRSLLAKNLKKFNTSLCIRSVVAHLHFPEARSRAWLILLIATKERFRGRMRKVKQRSGSLSRAKRSTLHARINARKTNCRFALRDHSSAPYI